MYKHFWNTSISASPSIPISFPYLGHWVIRPSLASPLSTQATYLIVYISPELVGLTVKPVDFMRGDVPSSDVNIAIARLCNIISYANMQRTV